MPPKEQNFDFETMAIVLYALGQSGLKLGAAHYKMMSDATNGKRGQDAFNHQFRAVKKRADEIALEVGGTPSKKGPKNTKVVTPNSEKKRGGRTQPDNDEDGDEEAQQKSNKKPKTKVTKDTVDELNLDHVASEYVADDTLH